MYPLVSHRPGPKPGISPSSRIELEWIIQVGWMIEVKWIIDLEQELYNENGNGLKVRFLLEAPEVPLIVELLRQQI